MTGTSLPVSFLKAVRIPSETMGGGERDQYGPSMSLANAKVERTLLDRAGALAAVSRLVESLRDSLIEADI